MALHRLVLPTRESFMLGNVKAYIIRCKCGWTHTARTFDDCVHEFGAHKREASS